MVILTAVTKENPHTVYFDQLLKNQAISGCFHAPSTTAGIVWKRMK